MVSRLAGVPLALGVFGALSATIGCGGPPQAKPVEGPTVCIVQNRNVRLTFFETVELTLRKNGYRVKRLESYASADACPLTASYSASWKWDVTQYMSSAEIVVVKDGKPAGKASYDASAGGVGEAKSIDTTTKITQLVNQLFPRVTGS